MKRKLKEFNVIEHLDSDEARVEYLREALRSVKEEPSGDAESDQRWISLFSKISQQNGTKNE